MEKLLETPFCMWLFEFLKSLEMRRFAIRCEPTSSQIRTMNVTEVGQIEKEMLDIKRTYSITMNLLIDVFLFDLKKNATGKTNKTLQILKQIPAVDTLQTCILENLINYIHKNPIIKNQQYNLIKNLSIVILHFH
jgi:hypothetical protein